MNLRIESLSHTYQKTGIEARKVLDIDALEFQAGEHVLLRGVSGSGKTTLLNILAGLLTPTTGAVWYGKQSLYALAEARRDRFRAQTIGYIFQTHHLLNALSALENVVMPMAFARQGEARHWRQRALEVLEAVGLHEFAHHRPFQLSTGQRLRVAVARAMVSRPKVVFADEPTAALDRGAAEVVMDFIQATCREHHAILITASHDPALEPRFSRVVDLVGGKIQEMRAMRQAVEATPEAIII